jgi:carbon-monoxide dehydrogenase medium subunit
MLARSHLRLRPFELHRPTSVAAALDHLTMGAALAGGVELIEAMKGGYQPAALVDLSLLPGWRRIERQGADLVLGAGVTHAQAIADPLVEAAIQGFQAVWRQIANPRIRAQGTLGGNLMAGNPAYDLLPVLMALEAEIVGVDPAGTAWRVPAGAPLHGLITAIHVRAGARLHFDRGWRPVLGVAAVRRGDRYRAAAVWGHGVPVAAPLRTAKAWVAAISPFITNAAGSADYRAAIAPVLAARALAALP